MLIYFAIILDIDIYISKGWLITIINHNWQATNYQKEKYISSTKKYIIQKLDELQRVLECPNEFIYNFIKDI